MYTGQGTLLLKSSINMRKSFNKSSKCIAIELHLPLKVTDIHRQQRSNRPANFLSHNNVVALKVVGIRQQHNQIQVCTRDSNLGHLRVWMVLMRRGGGDLPLGRILLRSNSSSSNSRRCLEVRWQTPITVGCGVQVVIVSNKLSITGDTHSTKLRRHLRVETRIP